MLKKILLISFLMLLVALGIITKTYASGKLLYFPVLVYVEPHPKAQIVYRAFAEWNKKTNNYAKFRFVNSEKQLPHFYVRFSGDKERDLGIERAVGLANSKTYRSTKYNVIITIYTLHPNTDIKLSDKELYHVSLHEIGHALGLDHTNDINDVMYPTTQSMVQTLSEGDLKQFWSIYSLKRK